MMLLRSMIAADERSSHEVNLVILAPPPECLPVVVKNDP